MTFQLDHTKTIRFNWFSLVVDLSFYLAIFGGTLNWEGILPFKVYLYYPIVPPLVIIFVYKYQVVNKYILIFSMLLLVAGVIQVAMGNNSMGGLIKIWSGALIHYLYYYYFLKFYNYDYRLIFRKYIRACYFLAWVAIVQLFSFVINFKPGYNFSWLLPTVHNPLQPGSPFRAQSLLTEPSTLAIHLIPVVFIGLCKLFFPNKDGNFITIKESIICIIGFLLSFSSTGFFGLAIAFMIIAVSRGNVKQLVIGLFTGLIAFVLLFNFSRDFQMRLINFTSLLFSSDINYADIGSTDTSNFVLFNNGWVAYKNILNHPFTGTGLGSHPIAYDRYSLTRDTGLAGSYYSYALELNKEDASSLLFRIMSETGFTGVILLFFFLFRYNFLLIKDSSDYQNWLISNACLVIISTCLLRAGHYFLLGIPLFFLIYFYVGLTKREETLQIPKLL